MTETQGTTVRADMDIAEEVESLIAHYPPSRNDQRHIQVQVKNGQVTLSGHIQTPNTRRYLVAQIPSVEGVRSVTADKLYDDEGIRLEVAKDLPVGVQLARVYYGTVILAGNLPEGMSEANLTAPVQKVPGVAQVITAFR